MSGTVTRLVFGVSLAALSATSCQSDLPPRGQILLVVDTDAVAPLVRGAQLDPTRLAPQIDRARFEVLADGKALAGSAREFAVDEAMFRGRHVSFGVLAEPGAPAVSVRVRLFRVDRTVSGDPPPGTALDTTVLLPAAPSDGIDTVSVTLRVDDVGRAVGPIPASAGAPAESLVNTWHGGHRTRCEGVAEAFESCVPGGAFFFGDAALRGRSANDVTDERLVTIAPFFIDRTEVTVGAFRERWPALMAAGARAPLLRGAADDPSDVASCTWTEDSRVLPDGTPPDRLPLNCVSWATASAYCQARGAALPTEAQLEYVSSGLGEEQAYPWGNDDPDCTTAIWGRARPRTGGTSSSACIAAQSGIAARPAFPGEGTRDRVDTAPFGVDSEIVDLGGNLSEWALDVWSQPSEAFWNRVTPMTDPVATLVGVDGDARVMRSGSWYAFPLATRASLRFNRAADTQTSYLGFRCARSARPSP